MNKVLEHQNVCKKLNDIYRRKNHDYNDAFGKGFQKYGLVMAIIRLDDKLSRLQGLLENKNFHVKDENLEDTLSDLANYAIMTLIELQALHDITDEKSQV